MTSVDAIGVSTSNTIASEESAREAVRTAIRDGAALNAPYVLMNSFAATIATYGLFANSPAVVIGAMIVAMLLGPILGSSLALVDNDIRGLGQALITLLAGAVSVMVTALILGLIHHELPITHEIMARTAPNLTDLMIALAGGGAGAYAIVSPRLSVAFVGVAIATALVPPLCSATILLARGEYDLGLGALLLTFTNIVAIQFAACVVLWATGFRHLTRRANSTLSLMTFLRRDFVGIALMIGLAFVLTNNLNAVVHRSLFETTVRETLARTVTGWAGNHLADVRFSYGKTSTIVRAVVRGPSPPRSKAIGEVQAQLPNASDRKPTDLRIRFVQTSVLTETGPLYTDEKSVDEE